VLAYEEKKQLQNLFPEAVLVLLNFVVRFQEPCKNSCYWVWIIQPDAIQLMLVCVHTVISLAVILIFITQSHFLPLSSL